MRLSIAGFTALLSAISFSPLVLAEPVIESSSLNSCQDGSNFTATLFNVAFTPNNNSIGINIVGFLRFKEMSPLSSKSSPMASQCSMRPSTPCTMGLRGMCPLSTGQINIETNIVVPSDIEARVPGIAYTVPDLDGIVRIYITSLDTGLTVACMEAQLSNTKTVDQVAVGWATAVIAGLALVASGITSGLGHTNTAAHVAANAVSLFGFFQAQAIIGMTAVTMPPIVQSWTQNFQWSMGIIKVGFLQSVSTWYQRATGGTPTTYLSTLATTSVQVEKRSLDTLHSMVRRGLNVLSRRAGASDQTDNQVIVRGIDRVGFRAGIEQTNIFMTGLIFFIVVLFIVAILVALFKGFCELAAKAGWMSSNKFTEFRNGWKIVLKGILFRLVLLGYVQMCVLCLWEIVERDSAAEVILALVVFVSMTAALFWAALKVIRLAKRSVIMHKNPAYILYSDPKCLNKWGFLYVQYRATAYYFVLPLLAYILCKAIFVAFAQKSPVAQAVGLVIVEAVALIGVSVVRPFMDKKTNAFNISIAAVNFVNAAFLLVFSNAFGQPEMVSGIMGVLFALYNVIFAAVLLILVLIASIYAVASKNPETRYAPMRDDRGSFIKSQAALTTELDALGQTARGDLKTPYHKGMEDDESFSTDSLNRQQEAPVGGTPVAPATGHSTYSREPVSPIESGPMYPGENSGRRGPPQSQDRYEQQGTTYGGDGHGYKRAPTSSPSPYGRTGSSHSNYQNQDAYAQARQPQFRNQNSSPWQRGAGYE